MYTRRSEIIRPVSDSVDTNVDIRRGSRHDNTRTAKARTSTNSEVSALISSAPAPVPSQASPASDPKINATNHSDAVYSFRATINTPRPVVSSQTADQMHENARRRRGLNREVQLAEITKAMASFGIAPPEPGYRTTHESTNGPVHLLNKPLQRALPELGRRSASSLPEFVEFVWRQTESYYHSNENLIPAVLGELCKECKPLEQLQNLAREGVEVRLKETPPRQSVRPPTHGSARDRFNVLLKNIQKALDARRCLVLDMSSGRW
ncbi:hypothetical protein JG688_00010433 [Phytophthora aleatoria]|uniref:Uncharacterized protein n=1 Tax=Phytophthora aleatoria TaxID=2496075 RepID=A0A8J5IQF5_9STRA|nr:hypothetical protein JG688_00010433 [Phytophthora aleatoria]